MPDLTQQQWGAIALAVGAVGMFAYSHFGEIKGWFGKLIPTSTVSDDRLEALKNLDELYAYFKGVKCQEGMEGVRNLVPHVFDEEHAEAHP